MTWSDVAYKLVSLNDRASEIVVEELQQTHVNGDVILRIFHPTDNQCFDHAWRTDRQGMQHLLASFLQSPSIRTAVPELNIPAQLPHIPAYTVQNGYEFEGAVTGLLLTSGAYVRSTLTDAQSRAMSQAFVDAVVGDHRLSVSVYRLEEAWTNWFFDVAWDDTFIVFDFQAKQWTLFCITDTD